MKISFGAGQGAADGRPGAWRGHQVEAYEIHHGLAEIEGEAEPFLDGWRQGQVWGTMWHGALENDDFRRAWLAEIAAAAGSSWRPDPEAPGLRRATRNHDQYAGGRRGAACRSWSAAGGHPGGWAAVTIQALVIGIGSGNPDHLTREAVAALNRVDVFLVADKGAAKHDLVKLREEICRAVITHDHYRFIEVPDPDRGPDRERDAADYQAGVAAWHEARARRYAEIIAAEVGRRRHDWFPGVGRSGLLRLHDPHRRVDQGAWS